MARDSNEQDGNGRSESTGSEHRAVLPPASTAPATMPPAAPVTRAGALLARLRNVKLPPLPFGLPTRLLLLTAAFVMMAETLIFVPTLSSFRLNWLEERLTAAQLAALAAEGYPGGQVPSSIRAELLRSAQVKAVASRTGGERRLVLPVDNDMKIDAHFDLRQSADGFISTLIQQFRLFGDAIGVLVAPANRTIRVLGRIGNEPDDLIEIVMPEAPLRNAMWQQSRNVLGLALLLSLFTAGVVYFALYRLVVQPILRLSRNMQAFSANPEDVSRIIVPSRRSDEVGTAERELALMQTQLSQLLAQRARLAELGLAVSKINHDLRNMLSSAQVISDRLTALPDATVQRFAPKLIASLDRAINFCNDTLRYGKSTENTPRRDLMLLAPLVEEVGDGLGLPREGAIDWVQDFDPTLRIDADPDHLYRIIGNLTRNAVQALETQADNAVPPSSVRGTITIKARREARRVILDVSDTGPGVPERARATLFKPFQGSTRKGGSGLGLAISAELATAHGGSLRLVEAAPGRPGATFRLEVPDRHAG